MEKIRILLVDDHSVVRIGLSTIINLEKDLTVCGEAESGEEAIRLAGKLQPDVIIMDLMMPGMDGADATKEVLKVAPDAKVLILTTFGSSADIAKALENGATGAVTKNLSDADLAETIRRTAAGKRQLSPEIRGSLSEQETPIEFSSRQMDIIASITRGFSNQEIATALGISRSRVKQHLAEVFGKLGAANRAEAVAIALRKQLLKM